MIPCRELITRSDQICVNVGMLGHVDCGKTSLCMALSTTASTAAFDSNPQSKARGITLDLGFSAFPLDNKYNVTLVDCPGHASLIRTVLGGVRIMDLMVLVVDVTKGMQPQTWECLILANITTCNLIIALNKVDLIPPPIRPEKMEKFCSLLRRSLKKTRFGSAPMVLTSTTDAEIGTDKLKDEILQHLNKMTLVRDTASSFVMAIDHCFSMRGSGAICTGTIITGQVKLNDTVEFPKLQTTKKVKTMQVFRQPVDYAKAGDRVALGIPGLDAKSMERGLITAPGLLPSASRAAIVKVNKIPFFKEQVPSGKRFHVSIGYSTVTAQVQFFSPDPTAKLRNDDAIFSRSKEYLVENVLEYVDEDDASRIYFALLVFDKPVFILPNTLIIASNLQQPDETVACRLAFQGQVIETSQDKDVKKTYLPTLKIFYYKKKSGIVDRVSSEDSIIVRGFCQKNSNVDHLIGMKVFVHGEKSEEIEDSLVSGRIQGRFGQTNKVRIGVDRPLTEEQIHYLKNHVCIVDITFKEYKFKIRTESGQKLCQ